MKKILYFIFFIIFLLFSENPAETSADPSLSGQKTVVRGTDEEEINKAVVTLKELGFTEISDELIDHMPEIFNESYYSEWDAQDVMVTLLVFLGEGTYDYDDWSFTPSSTQVYSFDMEVFDIENMYTQFFQGITAINNGEFEITDIQDEMSHMSEELGLGTRKISFRYNQNPYEFRAKVMYDWFDGNIIGYMNKVLKKEKNSKRLYCMTDGYQELIIFYCSEEWAAQFMLSTGFTLDKS